MPAATVSMSSVQCKDLPPSAHLHLLPSGSMWQALALRFALALCAAATVEAVISPKVFIIDFVRKPFAVIQFRKTDLGV